MSKSIELLDKLYSSELGCTPYDMNSGKLSIVSNSRIGGIKFAKGIPLVLFSITKADSTVVLVHPLLKTAADQILAGTTVLNDRICDLLEHSLNPDIDAEFWFRGIRLYCAPEMFTDRSFGEVRDVANMDEISKLLHAKWGGPVFGQIVDSNAVAWAAVKPLSDIAWDISIQTLPEYRGRGFARSVASSAVKYIFENGKLATWGTDTTNTASLKTARSVGFQEYGLDFGCVGVVK